MGAKNKVVKGDYLGECIIKEFLGKNLITGKSQKLLSKTTIKDYEVIDESKTKSGTSAVLRSAVGVALLGGVGMLAGLSAKNKGVYLIAIEFITGQKSLMEIDEKHYKIFRTSMF